MFSFNLAREVQRQGAEKWTSPRPPCERLRIPEGWCGVRQIFASCLVMALAAAQSPAVEPASETAPRDGCVVELRLPKGATVKLGGQDYGQQRRFTYQPLQPGTAYSVDLVVRFPNGEETSRPLVFEAGRLVRLVLTPPGEARLEPVPQNPHPSSVSRWAFSPDGSLLATHAFRSQVFLWDTATGKILRRFSGHRRGVDILAFSPDGRRLLTSSSTDKEPIYVWDVVTGQQLLALPLENARHACFSEDGRHVVTLRWGEVTHWDAATGQPTHSFKFPNAGDVNYTFELLSHQGSWVLAGIRDRPAILFDTAAGRSAQSFPGLTDAACMAMSPDGRSLIVGNHQGEVSCWDVAAGQRRWSVGQTSKDDTLPAIAHVRFSPDGSRVATVSYHVTCLWDTATGKRIDTYSAEDTQGGIWFSPEGKPLLALANGKEVVWWDIKTGTRTRQMPMTQLSSREIGSLDFTSDGRRLIVASDRVSLWDLAGGRHIAALQGSSQNSAVAPDGQRLYLATGKQALVVDTSTGAILKRINFDKDSFFHIRVSPDGRTLLVRSNDHDVVLYDAERGEKLRSFTQPHGVAECDRFSPDGRLLVVGYQENQAIVWDVGTGRKVQTVTTRDRVTSGLFSPDGRLLLTPAPEGHFHAWDVASGTQAYDIYVVGQEPTFSPDGRTLAVRYSEHLKLFDAATGREERELQGHTANIVSARFRADGRQLLTGSDDMTAALWDLAAGRQLQVFRGHTGPVTTAIFSPDNRWVVTGSDDGTVRFWEPATGQEVVRLVSMAGPSWNGAAEEWLALSPEGLFDGSAGARQQVLVRVGGGLNLVSVDRFFQDLFAPGLLAETLYGRRPLPTVDVTRNAPPKVRIVAPQGGGAVDQFQTTIEAEVVDQGGGIRGPWILQNDAKIFSPGAPRKADNALRRTFPVTLIEGDNRLEIRASNSDGSWESEPARITLRYERPLPKPEVHLLAVGIDRYADPSLAMHLAAEDAKAMVTLFEQRGQGLYGHVHATTLLDAQATKEAILAALAAIGRKARPQDVLVVFLAGHGTVSGQRYFFLPEEFHRKSEKFDDDVTAQGLLASDLGDALTAVPALKRMVIFDTGQSGAPLGTNRTARNPFAFRGAIERLSRSQGAFTIAAVATSDRAQEVPALRHGVLTYALLAGLGEVAEGPLAGHAIRPSEEVASSDEPVAHVLQWFGFASAQVPKLTKEFFGQAQDIQHSSLGSSFPVLPVRARTAAGAKPVQVTVVAEPPRPKAEELSREPSPRKVAPEPMPSAKPGELAEKPRLHMLSVGINRYAEEAINLKYAAPDAQAIAELFRSRSAGLYSQVQVKELIDGQATKAAILGAVDDAASQLHPDDLFAVFIAGHGIMVGQRYYFIPHEFRRLSGTLQDDVRQTGLPADLLADALAKAPARRRLLILDTCASGGALGLTRKGRDALAFQGAIRRLGQREGVFAIAASAAGEEAQEIQDLGHGVLTYTLLAALRAVDRGPLHGQGITPSDSQGSADVLEWFNFATDHVPRLTRRFLGKEQDVQTAGQGTAFLLLSAHGKTLAPGAAPAESSDEAVAEGTGILELDLPGDALVSIARGTPSAQRRFRVQPIEPGASHAVEVAVRFGSGAEKVQTVYLEAGRITRLRLRGATSGNPEPIIPSKAIGHIHLLRLTPDRKHLMFVDSLGLKIWEVATGRMLRRIDTGLGVMSAAMTADGQRLVTAGGNPTAKRGEIACWDLATWQKTRTMAVDEGAVQHLALTPDGRIAAIATFANPKVYLWDLSTGQKVRTLWAQSSAITAMATSPDGKLLATCSQERTIVLWDLASGEKRHVLMAPDSWVDGLAFSPDGRRLLTRGFGDKCLAALWDVETGENLKTFTLGGRGKSLTFNPDGRSFVADHTDFQKPDKNCFAIYDASTGKKLRELATRPDYKAAVAFSDDGGWLLSGESQGASTAFPVLWEASTGVRLREFSQGADLPMLGQISLDGRTLITGDVRGALDVWDLGKGMRNRRLSLDGDRSIQSLSLSADGRYVATGGAIQASDQGLAVVWEVETGKQVQAVPVKAYQLSCVALSPDGRELLTSTSADWATAWDVATGKKVRDYGGEYGQIGIARYSPDGKSVLITGTDLSQRLAQAVILDRATGSARHVFRKSASRFHFAAFSPNGRYLVVAGAEISATPKHTAFVLDAATGNQLHAIESPGYLAHATFTPDGKALLLNEMDASNPRTVTYSLETGKRLREIPAFFLGIGYTANGRLALGATVDGSMSVADASTGQIAARLYTLNQGRDWLVVSPDGFFDGSEGAIERLMFREGSGMGVVPAQQLAAKLRRPGLLASILAGNLPQ